LEFIIFSCYIVPLTFFSLAVEPVDKDVVKQGPRNVKTPMITKTLVLNVLFSASIIIVGTLWVFKREVRFYL